MLATMIESGFVKRWVSASLVLLFCSSRDGPFCQAWNFFAGTRIPISNASQKALEGSLSRRDVASEFASVLVMAVFLAGSSDPSWAQTDPLENRPFAPTEALIPATSNRWLLKTLKAMILQFAESNRAQKLPDVESRQPQVPSRLSEEQILQLRAYVLPPALTLGRRGTISGTRRYPTISATAINDDTTTPRLSGATMRAALNQYTANLRFADTYVLTASPADKKRYLRTYDRLPDVKQVITADLDLRDLYRNEIQTLVEDFQAELYRIDPDTGELLTLLTDANNAMDQWFALISPNDVQTALDQLHRRSKDASIALTSPS